MLLFTSVFFSCKSKASVSISNDNDIKKMISGDIPKIVYKTKKDYAKFVFVTMNKDKTKIISYPHPRDLNSNGKLLMPIELSNGYYLDQKGISQNSVLLQLPMKNTLL